jgi:flagellar basal body P-ring protein FlgI
LRNVASLVQAIVYTKNNAARTGGITLTKRCKTKRDVKRAAQVRRATNAESVTAWEYNLCVASPQYSTQIGLRAALQQSCAMKKPH